MQSNLQQNEFTKFVVQYSESELIEKLKQSNLSIENITHRLKINVNLMQETATAEARINEPCFAKQLLLIENKLKNWPAAQNITLLTDYINQLVRCCLDAMQAGVSSTTIFSFFRTLELKSFFGLSQSAQLHYFLFDLVTQAAQSQYKGQLNYALNFDANNKLPHSSQIVSILEEMNPKLNAEHSIGLFSMYFQISKHNPIYARNTSIYLSNKIVAILNENIDENCQLLSDGNLQFNILLTSLINPMQMNLLAAKVSRAFEQAISLENQSVLITPYIGCVCIENKPILIRDLYNHASLALSNAIQDQQTFVLYTDDFQNHLASKINRENRVLEAFSSDSLTLYFQPIVAISNNKILGAELLLRWLDMTNFSVAPGLTVAILNHSGRGKLFTRWLINSACRYASQLKYEHQLNIYLTLNLQADDLYDTELPHLLLQSVALWRIKPQDIVLEITEDGVLEYNDLTKSVIDTLVKNGFKLALDDFGTGYSSLSRLRNMPIDIIKIDQSFVREIKHSKQDYEIVKSIALLAKSLGKEVLAEGVEDEECLALIKKMKIDKCQGYFFAKPMAYEQFITWAKAH